MPVWVQAFFWGLACGLALVIGAALGYFTNLPQGLVAAVITFGSGVLISALSLELMDEAYKQGGFDSTMAGCLGGALLRKFAVQHGHDGEPTRRLIGMNDAAGAVQLIHNRSGVAGFLQAGQVVRLSEALEQALLTGEAGATAVLLEKLEAALQTVSASIDAFEAMQEVAKGWPAEANVGFGEGRSANPRTATCYGHWLAQPAPRAN